MCCLWFRFQHVRIQQVLVPTAAGLLYILQLFSAWFSVSVCATVHALSHDLRNWGKIKERNKAFFSTCNMQCSSYTRAHPSAFLLCMSHGDLASVRCRSNSTSLARSVSRRSSISEQPDAELESMSAICPLTDEYLPLDAGNLKNKQVCASMLTCWL